MKPNIFCLVVDALSAEQLNEDINAMPFVKNLMKSSVVAKNCYSQGPYTEAALTPFYTGRDNLDFCGNFFRGNEIKTNLFEYTLLEGQYPIALINSNNDEIIVDYRIDAVTKRIIVYDGMKIMYMYLRNRGFDL